jgi:hypothetical protein
MIGQRHILYPQPLKLKTGDRAVPAGLWLESLEPSIDNSVDAAWHEARERRRHARDQGAVGHDSAVAEWRFGGGLCLRPAVACAHTEEVDLCPPTCTFPSKTMTRS